MPCPAAEVVHRIHDRYLVEIVESLGLCPFARRTRELGRVHRPLWWTEADAPGAPECAAELGRVVAANPDAEIVLLTFVDLAGRFTGPAAFDGFVAELREAWAAADGPVFFMVGFHPELGGPVPRSPSGRSPRTPSSRPSGAPPTR